MFLGRIDSRPEKLFSFDSDFGPDDLFYRFLAFLESDSFSVQSSSDPKMIYFLAAINKTSS